VIVSDTNKQTPGDTKTMLMPGRLKHQRVTVWRLLGLEVAYHWTAGEEHIKLELELRMVTCRCVD
jgi:hypothetical protein